MTDHYTETVLYAVTGMSPAVLTETIWALAHENPPCLPDRIIVITTTVGRQRLLDELFSPASAVWVDLLRQLEKSGHPPANRLRFAPTPEHIRVPTYHPLDSRQAAHELADIRNQLENSVFADFILENLRGITDNPESLVIASLAGGRKTMSAFLYAALTLVGRPGDRLTHILVPPEVESPCRPPFYFPGQSDQRLATRDSGTINARDVPLQLADVPFTALRPLIEHHAGAAPAGFSQLVRQCGRRIDEVTTNLKLSLSPLRCEISLNQHPLLLAPRNFVLLLHLVQRTLQGIPAGTSYQEAFDDLVSFALQVKKNAPPGNLADWRHGASFPPSFEPDDIRKLVSSLRIQLQDEGPLGCQLALLLPKRRFFGLNLPPDQITLLDE